jgi:hypothetical protein
MDSIMDNNKEIEFMKQQLENVRQRIDYLSNMNCQLQNELNISVCI